MLHYRVLHCRVLHCRVLHCRVLHCRVLHCRVLHCRMLDYSRLQRLARDKHYSLLGSFISYKKWSVVNTTPDFYCHAGCHYPECRYVKSRGAPRFISLKKDEKCRKRKEEINIFFLPFNSKFIQLIFFFFKKDYFDRVLWFRQTSSDVITSFWQKFFKSFLQPWYLRNV